MKKKKHQKGFTLIELIIVISVIAILGGIAVPLYVNVIDDAHMAHMGGIEGVLHSAVVLWASENYLKTGELVYPSNDIVTIEYMTDPGLMVDWTDLGGGVWQYSHTGGTLVYNQTDGGNGYIVIKNYGVED